MRKKRAIRNFAGIIFLCLVVLIFTVISFQIPNSDYKFVGFARGINTGIQYQGGNILTYNVKANNENSEVSGNGLDSRSVYAENLLYNEFGYSTNVFKTSNSSLRVEVAHTGNNAEDVEEDIVNNVTKILNLSNELTITTKAVDDEDDSDDEIIPLSGTDIKNVSALEYNNTFGVNIEFTKAGREKIKDLTNSATESSSVTIYFYIGDYDNPFTQFSVSEKIDQNSIFISGSMSTLNEAKVMADQINSTKYNYSFENVSSVNITKAEAKMALIRSIIIACVVFIAISIYLAVKFKKLGLCGVLAMVIAALAQILLLLTLPGVSLTSSSFVMCILSVVFGGIICFVMFNKMNQEYAVGKKIHASVKFGFAKTYVYVLDVMAMFAIVMLVVLLLGTEMAKQFAISGIIGLVVYGLSCLLLTYLFAKMYVDICPAKAKNYGFKREAHIDELK